MAKSTIKMRAKAEGDSATVKALISHPMESGQRKDSKGEKIPAHYISEVVCTLNGATVMTAQWGPAVSKNPYLSFRIRGAKAGDMLKMSWVDNNGDTDEAEAAIK